MKILSSWQAPAIVRWLDASAAFGVAPEEAQLVEQKSIGWIFLGEDKGARVLAIAHTLDEENKGEITIIPAGQVVEVEVLMKKCSWKGKPLHQALGGQDGNEREVVAGSKEEADKEERR